MTYDWKEEMKKLARRNVESIINLELNSYPRDEPKAQKIYDAIYEIWQKAERGSPQESVYEEKLDEYKKILEYKKYASK